MGGGTGIFVTQTNPGATTQVGDTITVSGGLTPAIKESDCVSFDIVQGPPDPTGLPAETANITALDSAGQVITANQSGTINVGAGKSVVIKGAITIDGKINVNGGTLLVLDGVTIDGKIEGSNNGCIGVYNNVKVDGKVETSGAKCLVVSASNVDGKLSSNNDAFVRICNNTIKGKLEVKNPGNCKAGGNNVDGDTDLPANCVNCQ